MGNLEDLKKIIDLMVKRILSGDKTINVLDIVKYIRKYIKKVI